MSRIVYYIKIPFIFPFYIFYILFNLIFIFVIAIILMIMGYSSAFADSGIIFPYGNLQSTLGIYGRIYTKDPAFPEQNDNSKGIEFSSLYQLDFVDESRFSFLPYIKTNTEDSNFNYIDIRELNWKKSTDSWNFSFGIDTINWWTTESQHLVDIINQVDLREYPDSEIKLGQPLINTEYFFGQQSISLFILLGFRERPFSSTYSRLRPQIPIDENNPVYQDADEQYHIDYATRYSFSAGSMDFGLSYFYGTSREPSLLPVNDNQNNVILRPYYALIDQLGLDISYVLDAWILKLELIQRNGQLNFNGKIEDYLAYTTGFEYDASFISTGKEISLFFEYLYDERDELSTTGLQNDIFIGTRIGFNNTAGTSLLIGLYQDLSNGGQIYIIENEQRISQQFKLFTTAYFFNKLDPAGPFYDFREDDFIEMSVLYYF